MSTTISYLNHSLYRVSQSLLWYRYRHFFTQLPEQPLNVYWIILFPNSKPSVVLHCALIKIKFHISAYKALH